MISLQVEDFQDSTATAGVALQLLGSAVRSRFSSWLVHLARVCLSCSSLLGWTETEARNHGALSRPLLLRTIEAVTNSKLSRGTSARLAGEHRIIISRIARDSINSWTSFRERSFKPGTMWSRKNFYFFRLAPRSLV